MLSLFPVKLFLLFEYVAFKYKYHYELLREAFYATIDKIKNLCHILKSGVINFDTDGGQMLRTLFSKRGKYRKGYEKQFYFF